MLLESHEVNRQIADDVTHWLNRREYPTVGMKSPADGVRHARVVMRHFTY